MIIEKTVFKIDINQYNLKEVSLKARKIDYLKMIQKHEKR